jgi:uncharacterized membrane protein
MYKLALLLHIVGAFLLIAGTAVAGVSFEAARRRAKPSEISLLLGLSRAGVALVGLGVLLVLPFGIWLVRLGHRGFDTGWIVAALGLFAVTLVLGAAGGRRPKRARKLAARLAAEDAHATPELQALLQDRVALAANYLSALLLLVIVVLMVYKPSL